MILKALAKDPGHRHQTAQAMVDALNASIPAEVGQYAEMTRAFAEPALKPKQALLPWLRVSLAVTGLAALIGWLALLAGEPQISMNGRAATQAVAASGAFDADAPYPPPASTVPIVTVPPTVDETPPATASALPVAGTPPRTYVWLNWPYESNYNFDVDLTVASSPSSAVILFWAHQFSFMNGPGGYIGLQLVGNTHKALFSIWDALDGSMDCHAFSAEGSGWQCLIDYNWQVGITYKLRLWVLDKDEDQNEWWGAWVSDTATGQEQFIGSILVPAGRGWLSSSSVTWTEYAGYTSCTVPYSSALWTNPFARNGSGDGAPTSAQVSYGVSACSLSDVDPLTGTAYRIEAGESVTRDTSESAFLWH